MPVEFQQLLDLIEANKGQIAGWLAAVLAGLIVRLVQWGRANSAALKEVAGKIETQSRTAAVKVLLKADPLPGGAQTALDVAVATVDPGKVSPAWWKRLLIVLIPYARLLLRAAVKKV